MIIQREVHNTDLAKLLGTIDETELTKIFAASAVTYAEMHATFKRSLNGNRLTEEQYNEAVSAFSDQWENVDIPVVNNLVIEESGKLAQKYRKAAGGLNKAIELKPDN